MEIKINLNETVKVKLTDYGKDVYYHQFDDLNKRIIKNGGKPIEPHFPKEDENGYCEMQLWGLMELYGNYMAMEHQNVFKPFEIIYEYELKENDLINRQKEEIERLQKKANTPFAKITFDRYELQEIVDEYVKNIEIDINLAKSEAIKEFAAKLEYFVSNEDVEIVKPKCRYYGSYINGANQFRHQIKNGIDNLVKEMMVETNQRKEDEGK